MIPLHRGMAPELYRAVLAQATFLPPVHQSDKVNSRNVARALSFKNGLLQFNVDDINNLISHYLSPNSANPVIWFNPCRGAG